MELDCDNAQLIGIIIGRNQEEIFRNRRERYEYLKISNFEKIYCYQFNDDYENKRETFVVENAI